MSNEKDCSDKNQAKPRDYPNWRAHGRSYEDFQDEEETPYQPHRGRWTIGTFRSRIDRKLSGRESRTGSQATRGVEESRERIASNAEHRRRQSIEQEGERDEEQLPPEEGERRHRESARGSRRPLLRSMPGAFRIAGMDGHSSNNSLETDSHVESRNDIPINEEPIIGFLRAEVQQISAIDIHVIEEETPKKEPIQCRYAMVVCGLLLVAAITIGLVIGLVPKKSDSTPTTTPTLRPMTEEERPYRKLLEEFVGNSIMKPGTSQSRAVEWIVNEDPRQLPLDAPNLLQRYTLVLLYFTTTDNGRFSWAKCEPENNSEHADICELVRWLGSSHECEWSGVSCTLQETIKELDFSLPDIPTGTIPTVIGLLSNLDYLDIGENDFTGTIPDEIISPKLSTLHINNNRLTGSIPDSFYAATNLTRFWAFSNMLTGTISSQIGLLTHMESLLLSDNMMSGTLPSELGLLVHLFDLELDSNALTGTVPTEIAMLTKLSELGLGSNLLSGSLPSEIGRMRLETLRMDYNPIDGTIPDEYYYLTDLLTLDLQSMHLKGPISTQIGNMKSLETLRVENNGLTGTIPAELAELKYLHTARLNKNRFEGNIPDSICRNRVTNGGLLEVLQADCGPQGNPIQECSCCSVCCNRKADDQCYNVNT